MDIIRKGKGNNVNYLLHRELENFREVFGTHPTICARIWEMVDLTAMPGYTFFCHLLWALFFLRNYLQEAQHASFVGVDRKTFRKWVHPWVTAISSLRQPLFRWEDRPMDGYWTFAVDTVHCPVQEPYPFWPKWKSFKYHGAALSYQIVTSVKTGHILRVDGPFPAGRWTDSKICNFTLKNSVRHGREKGVGDRGYRHCNEIVSPWWAKGETPMSNLGKLHQAIRGRLEQTNGRIRKFQCTGDDKFRHTIPQHEHSFFAACVIVQLEIECGIASQFDLPK